MKNALTIVQQPRHRHRHQIGWPGLPFISRKSVTRHRHASHAVIDPVSLRGADAATDTFIVLHSVSGYNGI